MSVENAVDQKVVNDTPALTPPDKAEYEEKLAQLSNGVTEIDATIADLQTQLDAHDDQSSGLGNEKSKVVTDLRACRANKARLYSSTSSLRVQLSSLDKQRMEIRRTIQSCLQGLKYTDMKSHDKAVKELKAQIKAGEIQLTRELESLISHRAKVIRLEEATKAEEDLEKETDVLRPQMDKESKQSQKVRKKESQLLDALSAIQKKEDNREVQTLGKKLREAQDAKRKISQAMTALSKSFEKEERTYTRSLAKQNKAKEAPKEKVTVTKKPISRSEWKAPRRDPYEEQIKILHILVAYVRTLMPKDATTSAATQEVKGRTDKNTGFEGQKFTKMVASKKQGDDAAGFNIPMKQKKKKNRNRKQKARLVFLNHPQLETRLFKKVQISPPLYTSNALATFEQLQKKIEFYQTAPAPVAQKVEDVPAEKAPEPAQHVEQLDNQEEFPSINNAEPGKVAEVHWGNAEPKEEEKTVEEPEEPTVEAGEPEVEADEPEVEAKEAEVEAKEAEVEAQ